MTALQTLTSTVDPVTHPRWCDPDRCTVDPDLPLEDAYHLSSTVALDAPITPAGPVDVDAWLHQSATGGEVYLVIDLLGSPDRAMFPLAAAAAAAGAVTQLLELATEAAHPAAVR